MSAPVDTSETGMANGALALIGEPPISSLDDATRAAARYAKKFFAETRDELLRAKDWEFARSFVYAPPAVACPNTRWAWRYTLPTDCIAAKRIGDYETYTDEPDWESPNVGDDATVATVVDTDAVAPRIYYTRRLVNPAQWDEEFSETFKKKLAATLNPLIGRDKTLTASLLGQLKDKREEAASRDSQQRNGETITRSTPWVTSRFGVYDGRR